MIPPPIQSRPALGVFRPFAGVLRRGGGIVPPPTFATKYGRFLIVRSLFDDATTGRPPQWTEPGRPTRPAPFWGEKEKPGTLRANAAADRGGGTPPAPCLKKARPKYQTAKNLIFGKFEVFGKLPRFGPCCSICGRFPFRAWNYTPAPVRVEIRAVFGITRRLRPIVRPRRIMRARWEPLRRRPPCSRYISPSGNFAKCPAGGAGTTAQYWPCIALYGRFDVQKRGFCPFFNERGGNVENLTL